MNVVVAQSGGPTSVINASLLGVYRQAKAWDAVDTVYGSLNGIEGILNDNLVSLNEALATDETMALLRQTPSAALRSCRHKLPSYEQSPEVYENIRRTLEKHDIGAFFYIGGNDSMDTVHKLSAYFSLVDCPIRVMGVPKTIDNDLMVTDHTPGYGSAAKFVATTMREIIRDCTVYDLNSVTIVEIMGRDTGWLTAAAALPRLNGDTAPHLVYLPEVPFSVDAFVEDIQRIQRYSRTVVVAVSEGVEIDTLGDYQSGKVDNFGHKYLSGIGKCLEDVVRERIGCKVRSIELNLPQRCAAHVSSLTDVEEAEGVGAAAVRAAMQGVTGHMAIIRRVGDTPYRVDFDHIPVSQAANAVKYVPREWINEQGNNVTEEALTYIRPLILGELPVITENGMPKHFTL
ncbi:MAG: 6-phosphofructokinase [Ruminococcaceae bacterium]|nr:6-phosphofructokinase [Oscillospiraceae bacterium]